MSLAVASLATSSVLVIVSVGVLISSASAVLTVVRLPALGSTGDFASSMWASLSIGRSFGGVFPSDASLASWALACSSGGFLGVLASFMLALSLLSS